MPRAIRLLLPVALLSLAACGPVMDFDANEGADEADLAHSESALMAEEAEVADEDATSCTTLSPEALALKAVTRASTRFSPASCVSASAQGATVTYQLDACSGRFGAGSITGTLKVTFSQEADGLHVVATGTSLQARRATFDLNVTGVCQRVGAFNEWTVTSAASGSCRRGGLSHQGAYTIRVDRVNQCAEVDGSWTDTGMMRRRSRTVTITDLARCANACPSGGTIAVQRPDGVTMTVQFDGSNQASWSDSQGNAGVRTLRCGQ